MGVAATGRGSVSISAAAVGNEIQLQHNAFGSELGFTVAFTGGGTDNTGQLGIAAATYNGTDVAGTIGGYTATGAGQQLVGDTDTPVAGLQIRYTDTTARSAGQVTLSLGTGAMLERILDQLLDSGEGIFDLREQAYGERITAWESKIQSMEGRLDLRRQSLIKQYTQMEVVIGQLQLQSDAISSQLVGLNALISRR